MVFVKYAEQDCTLITGNTKIEYGYNNDGIFYSEYGGNPVMKDPYKKGEVLFSKQVNGTSFNEELEIESGYYKLWVIARGGAGAGGQFFGIVKLLKGRYRFNGQNNATLYDPNGIAVINCTTGGSGTTPYGKQGEQGKGGSVELKDSSFLTINRPFTMAGLGGIVRTTGGVINQGYQFYEEVEDFGQGANGSSYSASSIYNPKDGIIKLIYVGEVPSIQQREVYFGGLGQLKRNKNLSY